MRGPQCDDHVVVGEVSAHRSMVRSQSVHSKSASRRFGDVLHSLTVVSSADGTVVSSLIFQYRNGSSKFCGSVPQTARAKELRWHTVSLADSEYFDRFEFRHGCLPKVRMVDAAEERGQCVPLAPGDEVSVWWWSSGTEPADGWSETLHADADILIGQDRGRWRPAVVVADAKQHFAPQPRATAEAALPVTKLRVEFKDARDLPDARAACVARSRVRRIVVDLAMCEFRIRSSTLGVKKIPPTRRYTRVFGGRGGAATDAEVEANRGSTDFKREGAIRDGRIMVEISRTEGSDGTVLSSPAEIGAIVEDDVEDCDTVRKLREFVETTEVASTTRARRKMRVEVLSQRNCGCEVDANRKEVCRLGDVTLLPLHVQCTDDARYYDAPTVFNAEHFEIASLGPVWHPDERKGGGGSGKWVVDIRKEKRRPLIQWTAARMQRAVSEFAPDSAMPSDSHLDVERWREALYASIHLAQVEYGHIESSTAMFDAKQQMVHLAEDTLDAVMQDTVVSKLARLVERAVWDACRRYPAAELAHIDRNSSAFQLALHEVAGLPRLRAGQLREAIESVMETLGPLSELKLDAQR